jgi:hypothetical protein
LCKRRSKLFATCNRDLLTRLVETPAFSTQFGTVARSVRLKSQ